MMDPIFEIMFAGALPAIVLITLQLVIALTSVLQIEFIVASFCDQATLYPPEEIWLSQLPFNCQASPKKGTESSGQTREIGSC